MPSFLSENYMNKTEEAKASLNGEYEEKVTSPDTLSTGLTLLDLAIDGGLRKGHVYRVAGRSGAGKTFLCRTILAEASINEAFDGYELIYDDVERGALMDTAKFFGQGLVDRLVPPARSKNKQPIYSKTVGDFYRRIRAKLEDGKSLIWICDSLDSLSPDAENNKMSDGKAKAHSQELRKLLDPLEETKSILIMVAQVRVDMRSPYGEDMTAGGRAPEFYSTLDIWLKKIKTLKTVYKGKKYANGIQVIARVKKNRLAGGDKSIIFPFHPSYGIDDTGACVDFLASAGHWSKSKGTISAPEFGHTGTRTKLIEIIEADEDGELQDRLVTLTEKVWKEIETATSVKRKPRYE
jgi:RecA/RadA recombinase